MLEHINQTFSGFLNRHQIGAQLSSTQIVLTAKKIAGDRFVPLSFRGGTLKVSVASNAHRYKLSGEMQEIVSQINMELGDNKVKRIKLIIGA